MLRLIQFFNKFLTPKNILALGEHLYKILEKTIWVKPYCPWQNFLNTFLIKKELLMEICITIKSLYGQYESNHIVPQSGFY